MLVIPERASATPQSVSRSSPTAEPVAPFPRDFAGCVLIVEDDPFVRDVALGLLAGPGWRVIAVSSLDWAEPMAGRHNSDLIVVGAVEAKGGGLSSRLRHALSLPIIPLFRPSIYAKPRRGMTARSGPLLAALADCRIRIDQHLRASALSSDMVMRWGDFTLRLEPGSFAFQGKDVGMTGVESAILYLLMRHPGELMGTALIEQVIFRKPRSQSNFIPVHISRIRAKLRATRSDISIENVRGEGYVLFWSRSFEHSRIPGLEVLDGAGASEWPATSEVSRHPCRICD